MYPVSSIFQMLMQRLDSTSTESAYGTLSLRNSDGIVTYNFDENAIIQGSLVIKDQLGDGKFGFGGAYIRNMSVKIDCDKIEGLSATNINLTNAEIEIWYRLNYNRGQSQEDVYMGKFYIDSRNSSRKFQILSLIGEDCLSKFDVTSVAMASASPYEVYATACGLAGVEPIAGRISGWCHLGKNASASRKPSPCVAHSSLASSFPWLGACQSAEPPSFALALPSI